MEVLDVIEYFRELYNNEEYEQVIEEISELLISNPDYLNENYLSFENRFEKEIYKKYFNLDEESVIFEEFNLSDLFLIYAISFQNTYRIDEAEKYLKIANKINPVSTPVLIHFCQLYRIKMDWSNVIKTADKILKYDYYSNILFYTYVYLLKSQYSTEGYEYSKVFISEIDFQSSEYVESLEKSLIFLNQKNIQIGYNLELLDISKRLYDEAVSNHLDDLDFINMIYRHLYGGNSFLKGLSLDINLDNITEEVKISIANNEIESAILKIQNFLETDNLDLSLNYKIFNNELEREFYYDCPDFDYNFILLPKHKNYYYLHYLYGYCLEKQEKYDDAVGQYQKALEFNPYSIFVNTALIKLKFNNNLPIKIGELKRLADISYTRDDLFKVYRLFMRFLQKKGRREDGELIDILVSVLKTKSYRNINQKAITLLEDNNLTVGFNQDVITSLESIVKYYSENEIKDLELYQEYLAECIELNETLSVFKNSEVNLAKSGLITEFSEEELIDSFILVEDRFSEKYHSKLAFFKTEFDEKEFDMNDSFICYCYRQVTGPIAFLVLSISSMGEDLKIYDRQYFYRDVIIKKEQLDGVKLTILDDLTQFDHYIDSEEDYLKWIERNVSGDKEIDKEFLLNELKNVDDDPFDIKRNSIGRELKNIINPQESAKKEIPCQDCIDKVNSLIDNGDYKRGLIVIEEFLNEFPPLYFDEYMFKYVYFDELEREIYLRYCDPTKRLINLDSSQNYCEIYNLKAKILLHFEKYDDAVDSALECLKLNPINSEANIILADAFVKKQDLNHAKKLLKEALQFSRDLKTHINIYKKLILIYGQLNDDKLAQNLTSLVKMLNDLNFDDAEISKIKQPVIDDMVYFGFNQDMISDNKKLLEINEKLHKGTLIDNILQQTKPLILNDLKIASEKLSDFISVNRFVEDYEIPYDKFDMSMMYGDESDGDKFHNFENNIDYEIFKKLNPDVSDLRLISPGFRVCDLLNTYARSLKIYAGGKSVEILKESDKLNPVNSRTLLIYIEVYLRLEWLDEAKEIFDRLFEVCYDKKILMEAYENLSFYYKFRGLRETSEVIEEFTETLKSNLDVKKEHIGVLRKHNVPLGFNSQIMDIVKGLDLEKYNEMVEFNQKLDVD